MFTSPSFPSFTVAFYPPVFVSFFRIVVLCFGTHFAVCALRCGLFYYWCFFFPLLFFSLLFVYDCPGSPCFLWIFMASKIWLRCFVLCGPLFFGFKLVSFFLLAALFYVSWLNFRQVVVGVGGVWFRFFVFVFLGSLLPFIFFSDAEDVYLFFLLFVFSNVSYFYGVFCRSFFFCLSPVVHPLGCVLFRAGLLFCLCVGSEGLFVFSFSCFFVLFLSVFLVLFSMFACLDFEFAFHLLSWPS